MGGWGGRQICPELFVMMGSTMTSDKADIYQHLLPRHINYPSLHAYSPSQAMNMQWPRMSHIHIADAQQRVNITYPSLTGHQEKLSKGHSGSGTVCRPFMMTGNGDAPTRIQLIVQVISSLLTPPPPEEVHDKIQMCVCWKQVFLFKISNTIQAFYTEFSLIFFFLPSLKASLSFSGMVKNAVESGRSFISFVPVGGVGHRLTNGPVKMLQLSE